MSSLVDFPLYACVSTVYFWMCCLNYCRPEFPPGVIKYLSTYKTNNSLNIYEIIWWSSHLSTYIAIFVCLRWQNIDFKYFAALLVRKKTDKWRRNYNLSFPLLITIHQRSKPQQTINNSFKTGKEKQIWIRWTHYLASGGQNLNPRMFITHIFDLITVRSRDKYYNHASIEPSTCHYAV